MARAMTRAEPRKNGSRISFLWNSWRGSSSRLPFLRFDLHFALEICAGSRDLSHRGPRQSVGRSGRGFHPTLQGDVHSGFFSSGSKGTQFFLRQPQGTQPIFEFPHKKKVQAIEDAAGEAFFEEVGCLIVGDPSLDWIHRIRRTLAAFGTEGKDFFALDGKAAIEAEFSFLRPGGTHARTLLQVC